MTLTNPRYVTPDDGGPRPILTNEGVSFTDALDAKGDPKNKHYADLVAAGVPIAACVAPPVNYEDQRRAEYPPLGDQLDAIWKQLNQNRLSGKALIQEADDLLNAVLAVKAKYPKPK